MCNVCLLVRKPGDAERQNPNFLESRSNRDQSRKKINEWKCTAYNPETSKYQNNLLWKKNNETRRLLRVFAVLGNEPRASFILGNQ